MFNGVSARLGACLVALVLAGGVAACGDDEEAEGGSSGSAATTAAAEPTATGGIAEAKKRAEELANPPQYEVAALPKTPPKGKRVAQVNCAVPSCTPGALAEPVKALGWSLKVHDYDVTKGPTDMARALNEAIRSKPDYIVATFVFPAATTGKALQEAEAAGIPVVAVGAETPNGNPVPGAVASTQNAAAFVALGKDQGAAIIADAGEPTNVAVVYDKTTPTLSEIAMGIKDGLKEYGEGTKSEDVLVSLAKPPTENVSTIAAFLQKNPDVKYLAMAGTVFFGGLYPKLKSAGLTDKVKLIGSFPFQNDLQSLEKGEWTAMIGGESTHQWREAHLLAQLSVGEKIDDPTPGNATRLITKDTVTPESIDPPGYSDAFLKAWNVE